MLDQRPNPYATVDRAIADLSDDEGDYVRLVSEFEAVARQVLAEQGVPYSTISIQTLTSEHQELSDRASKAMSALISLRLLKMWEQEAIAGGKATTKTFYQVAHTAMIVTLATTLVSPMIADLDADAAKAKRGPKRGGKARAENFASRDESAKSVLLALWKKGARFKVLKEWSGAISAELPEVAPSKDQSFAQMNRKVAKWGKDAFGAEWSVPPKKKRAVLSTPRT